MARRPSADVLQEPEAEQKVLSGGAGPDSRLDRGQPRRAGGRGFPLVVVCTAGPKIPRLKARKIKGVRNSWFTYPLLLLPRLIEQSVPSVRRH